MPAPEAPRTVRVFSNATRSAAVSLQALALANLLELGVRVSMDALAPGDHERAPLPLLARRVFFATVLPLMALRVISALSRARLHVRADRLALATPREELAVPIASIASTEPLWPPLPQPGVALRLRSGRAIVLTTTELPALVAWLGASGVPTPGEEHAGRIADAEAHRRTAGLRNPWLQLGLVPAAVTFILFRLHQIITFGGLLDEVYMLGFRSWLHTLTGVAVYVLAHLLVIAGCLRALAGAASWTAALTTSSAARPVRLAAELLATLAYDGGIAGVLALRLLA